MSDTNLTKKQQNTITANRLADAARFADTAASADIFAEHHVRRAAKTVRGYRDDLARFAECLRVTAKVDLADTALFTDPASWGAITWGLVEMFKRWQLQNGYTIGTVNRSLSTIRLHAKLAYKADLIDEAAYNKIALVNGYSRNEAVEVDKHRKETRRGKKKAEHVTIADSLIRCLKRDHENNPQGRRDAVLMSLLLDHGLRASEVAGLRVKDIDLEDGKMRFYRRKVKKTQTHNLSIDALKALRVYIQAGDAPLMVDSPLLRASKKNGELTSTGLSTRAITHRVKVLGEQCGMTGLSAHDCRHSWATRAASYGTDPFALQEAGGWASLAMPRRYVETAAIANERVKLGDE